MFREMRRKKQLLSMDECKKILSDGTSGVLALSYGQDYPYAVPVSYVYYNSKIYFHSAKTGHKIDAIKQYPKASFCVIGQDHIVPEKYTTYYKSVIAFGNIHIMETESEMKTAKNALRELAIKYAPNDSEPGRNAEIDRLWDSLCMIEFSIKHLSGKKALEL